MYCDHSPRLQYDKTVHYVVEVLKEYKGFESPNTSEEMSLFRKNLFGFVMQTSGGKANPSRVKDLLEKYITSGVVINEELLETIK